MRPGPNSVGLLQKGFEANAEFGVIVMAITRHEKEGTLKEQSSFGNGAN
jgi:hypothetical protein